MAAFDTNEIGRVSRALPQATPDGQPSIQRLGRYGGNMVENVIPTKHTLADEGSYFVSTNPTPGTALAYNVQASFSDTVPFIYIFNKSLPGDAANKRIFLDYIKLICTVAPASGTNAQFAAKSDSIARALTTNNTIAITPVNPNSDIGASSIATVNAQNSATASAIAAASAGARTVARGSVGSIPIINDELVFIFGSMVDGAYPGSTAAQTIASRKVSVCPPLIIGPQQSLTAHLWFASNATTGLSYEFEMGHWER